MRYTTTIVLCVIAAGLAAYVFLFERHQKTSIEVEADRVKLAPGLDRDAVTRIAITRGGGAVTLERAGAKDPWRLTAPALGPADASAVAELLSSVEYLEYRAQVKDAGARARAEYGLSPPKATVRLKAGGREVILHAGNDDASGQGVYAARGDEPQVYVVEKRFRELVDRDADALRDRHALLFDPAKVKGLAVGGTTLAKEPGGWFVTAPQRLRASDAKVQELLRAIESARATRFVAAPAAADPAARAITVTEDAAQSLSVGGACPGYPTEVLAVRTGASAATLCLAKTDASRLEVEPEALRDLRLFTIRPEDARVVTIRVEGRELTLTRDAGSWRVTAPAAGSADDDVVRKWLEDLGAYRAVKVEAGDPAAHGLAPGKAPVSVAVKGEGGASCEISLGPARDGRRWARRGDEPVLLQVHAEAGDIVSADPLHFRSRKVMSVPRWDVRTITVTAGGTTEVAERGSGDRWQLVKPITLDADTALIDKLLAAVADLRAEKLLPGAASAAFQGAHTVQIDTKPADTAAIPDGGAVKPQSFTLEIGSDTPEKGCYARVNGAVMVLGRTACEDLRVRLATRQLVELGEQAVTAVTIQRGGKTETLEKAGAAWRRAAGPALSPEQIEEVLGALRGLTAKGVARYGADPGHGLAPARVEIALKLDGGKDIRLSIGAEGDGGYYARVAGRDLTYIVPRGAVDMVEKLAP